MRLAAKAALLVLSAGVVTLNIGACLLQWVGDALWFRNIR